MLNRTYALVYPVPDAICGSCEEAAVAVSKSFVFADSLFMPYISVAKAPMKIVPMKVVFLFTMVLHSLLDLDRWISEVAVGDARVETGDDSCHLSAWFKLGCRC